jgi:hypothetical protein
MEIDMEINFTANSEDVLSDASEEELKDLLGDVIDALLEKHIESFDIVAYVVETLAKGEAS